jgi:hypothetical protein
MPASAAAQRSRSPEELAAELEESLEWEEWQGDGHFWHHMLAGSCAGVVEHTCMYPVDTYKVRRRGCERE